MKKRLVLPIGIPASGKSTIREEMLKETPDLCVVSPDEIRFEMLDYERTGISFDPEIEKYVWQKAFGKLHGCVRRGRDIFFDATNIERSGRHSIIRSVDKREYDIIAKRIYIDPSLALLRNQKRERKVPKDVICKKHLGIDEPTFIEGFNKIEPVRMVPSPEEAREIKEHGDEYDCEKILSRKS